MKIMKVYEENCLYEETSAKDKKLNRRRFYDDINCFEYLFYENGMIYCHTFDSDEDYMHWYQMNLKFKYSEGTIVRIKIHGLARQMKFALPRILARRLK